MNIQTTITSINNRKYPTSFCVGNSLLGRLHEFDQIKHKNYSSFLIVMDSTTDKLFSNLLFRSLKKLNKSVRVSVIPAGETAKNLALLADYMKPFISKSLKRDSALIAVGGGVTSDVGGFIASILLRGIDAIYIPTTLLAQIDAGVGGKTGMNFITNSQSMYKNIIGTFHMPSLVISDINVLSTLPDREITSGLGEMVKYWIGWGKPTLKQLYNVKKTIKIMSGKNTSDGGPERAKRVERNFPEVKELMKTILVCQQLKASIVKKDPYELSGLRQKLNLGHTIGHGIESAANGKLSHGEAVAIGLVGAAKLSVAMNMLYSQKANEIESTIKSLGLPIRAKQINTNDVLQAMTMDKKGGTFVLISDIGRIQEGITVEASLIKQILNKIILS